MVPKRLVLLYSLLGVGILMVAAGLIFAFSRV
jgi:hypothetical protein